MSDQIGPSQKEQREKFKALRKRSGLTQKQVANWFGYSESAISHKEIGHRNVRPVDILAIQCLVYLFEKEP